MVKHSQVKRFKELPIKVTDEKSKSIVFTLSNKFTYATWSKSMSYSCISVVLGEDAKLALSARR